MGAKFVSSQDLIHSQRKIRHSLSATSKFFTMRTTLVLVSLLSLVSLSLQMSDEKKCYGPRGERYPVGHKMTQRGKEVCCEEKGQHEYRWTKRPAKAGRVRAYTMPADFPPFPPFDGPNGPHGPRGPGG